MPSTSFTKADVRRVIEAAKEAEFSVGAVEITKDGTIRILPRADESDQGDKREPEPWS